MLAAVQFPICDARPFAPDDVGRLLVPNWPPRYDWNPEFVRSFGPAARRFRGSDAAWLDERAYCRANRAIQFPGLDATVLGRVGSTLDDSVDGVGFAPRIAFRRLFSDGKSVVRVEVGLTGDRSKPPYRSTDPRDVIALVKGLFELPTDVRRWADSRVRRGMIEQGANLARLFASASTKLAVARPPAQIPLVAGGRPLLLLEYAPAEIPEMPTGLRRVDTEKVRGATLAFGWMRSRLGVVGTWFLDRESAERDDIRGLRICLMRLHAEQECLDLILRQIADGTLRFEAGTQAADALEGYLNTATRLINREVWGGISQTSILDALDAADSVQYADARSALAQQLNGARAQVKKKVEAYEARRTAVRTVQMFDLRQVNIAEGGILVERNEGQIITGGTFTGPVINKLLAEHIENSFNTIQNSGANDELKLSLQEVHAQVKRLIEDMSEKGLAESEEVASQLDVFVEQATKENPLKNVLKSTAEAIVATAKWVGTNAAPIITAINTVLKLVGAPALPV